MNDRPTPPDSPSTQGPHRPEMTLSEEELVVTTELVETGRARLVKRVEVETVTRTIELRREVLEIERLDPEPDDGAETAGRKGDRSGSAALVLGTGPMAPGSLQAGTVEIVLMQEEALISTQLVPRERVRLTKEVIAEDYAVDAELSSERVDLEQRRPAETGPPQAERAEPRRTAPADSA